MPNKLATLVTAVAFAASIVPAHAAGMPDTGTKNFVPGGDAPSYLTNENLAVAPGSAAEPAAATADDQTEGSESSTGAPVHWAQTRAQHHGKLAADRKTAQRTAAKAKTHIRSSHFANAKTVRGSKATSLGKDVRPTRPVSKTASSARTGTAMHGKASVRHAAARSSARRG